VISNKPTKRFAGLMRKRWFQAALLCLVAVLVGGFLYVRHEIGALPEWWKPADGSSRETIALGESTENLVLSEMNRVQGRRDGSEWTLELGEEEINAWLAARMPRWAANQFPGSFLAKGVTQAHVRLEEGGIIRLGALIDFDSRSGGGSGSANESGQGVSVELVPEIDDADGRLRLVISGARIGRLRVPTGSVIGMVMDHFDVPNRELRDLLEGRAVEAVVKRGKNRRMVLMSVVVERGRLVLGWKTELGNGDGGGGG